MGATGSVGVALPAGIGTDRAAAVSGAGNERLGLATIEGQTVTPGLYTPAGVPARECVGRLNGTLCPSAKAAGHVGRDGGFTRAPGGEHHRRRSSPAPTR